ncbi:hypothetical protein BH23BAC1_BH23BAC1_08000 [soil metagenome]
MKNNKKYIPGIFLFLLLSFSIGSLRGQDQVNIKKLEKEAYNHARVGEWYFALPLFIKLSDLDPKNAEYAFTTGECYFNTIDKAKGLNYFQQASKTGHKSELLNFYLGRAFHFNLLFDSAILYYNKSLLESSVILGNRESQLEKKPKALEFQKYIENCYTGIKLVENPVELRIENMGPIINTKYPEYVPVISADENILMFTTRRNTTTGKSLDMDGRYYEDIYISKKNELGEWANPVSIGEPINSKLHDACIGLSPDGSKLLIYNGTNGGDIFISEFKNNTWSRPKKIGGDINTPFWEGSASFTLEEDILYFSSDRPGGLGGSDLYYSKRLPNGNWGKAINLGPTINTAFDEDAPQIHVDGKTLFFSSKGHDGMGGYDIFSSTLNKDDSTWTKPRNIGYPINTADDDIYFSLTADGSKGYFTSYRNDGYGEQDIYIMHRPLSSPAYVLLKGRVLDEYKNPLEANITLTDKVKQVVEKTTKSDPKTGSYSFEMEFNKDYNLTVEADGYLFFSENINIGKQPDIFEYVMNFSSGKNNVFVVEIFNGVESVAYNEKIDINSIRSTDLISEKKSLEINTRISDVKIIKKNEDYLVQHRKLVPLEVGKKMVLNHIYFDFDKATLKFESATELKNLYNFLSKHQTLQVEISGHTDNVGRKKYNQRLSEARAKAVYDYLVHKGIAGPRLILVGYGDSRPLISNFTPEGRQINRRTEFEIINIDKSGGLVADGKNLIEPNENYFSTRSLPGFRSDTGAETVLPLKAHFMHNDGKILTQYSKARLNTFIELSKKEKEVNFIIVGYEDFETEDSGRNLSRERARTVYNYLTSHGISKDRLEIKSSNEINYQQKVALQQGIQRRKVEFLISNK